MDWCCCCRPAGAGNPSCGGHSRLCPAAHCLVSLHPPSPQLRAAALQLPQAQGQRPHAPGPPHLQRRLGVGHLGVGGLQLQGGQQRGGCRALALACAAARVQGATLLRRRCSCPRRPLQAMPLAESPCLSMPMLCPQHYRKNQYEEALFRAEDDHFELDMIIDQNASAIKALRVRCGWRLGWLRCAALSSNTAGAAAGGHLFWSQLADRYVPLVPPPPCSRWRRSWRR